MALSDGRALPASRLAAEAGVAQSTASSHLAVLLRQGLVTVEQSGRHRFYRLAGPQVEGVLEALAQLAPVTPVTSLRAHTKASRLREGRTCYGHLAGRLGVRLFAAMLDRDWITGGDGRYDPGLDALSSVGKGRQYRLTDAGRDGLAGIGVDVPCGDGPVRYCLDWTEQAHHCAGSLGSAIRAAFVAQDWVRPGRVARSVTLTDGGLAAIAGIEGA